MNVRWREVERSSGVEQRQFTIEAGSRAIPGVFWCAEGMTGAAPLVLLGHGGSQHKTAPEMLELATLFVRNHGFTAAAIDGPIHGERRTDGISDRARIRDEFLAMWRVDNRVDAMVTDWQRALDVLSALPQVNARAVGWCGISMGTAYGLPLCAADERIRVALLGMWSCSYPNSARLCDAALRVACPVMFQQKWDDELFDRAGQIALFEAVGSRDKRLCVYPGGHVTPAGEQRDDFERYLVNRLV